MYLLFGLLTIFSCTRNSGETAPKDHPGHFSFDTTITISPPTYILPLPEILEEVSGLEFDGSRLLLHTDSKGQPVIYSMNPGNDKKLKEFRLEAENKDWEDIAVGGNHIFVSDMGNNYGARKDLRMYRIDKKDLNTENEIETKVFNLSYKNQESFGYSHQKTSFDGEAIFYRNDSVWFLTKNWNDRTTALMAIPNKPGNYELSSIDNFDCDGLITGADFNQKLKVLALCGYSYYGSFVWLIDFKKRSSGYFSGKAVRILNPPNESMQTEGICFLNDSTILVSTEEISRVKQSVYKYDIGKLIRMLQ